MKPSTMFSVLIVVVIVAVAVIYAFRSPVEAPAPSTSPGFRDITQPASGNGQFVQLEPSTTPPATETETTDSAQDSDSSSSSPVTSETVTINVDETGFAPSEVTIVAGDTVTFVNNGQGKHWPASDVHPTHQLLPEFDAKRGLETGETYSFTFTKAGSWTMHDHLQPSSTGTITVQ